MNTSMGSLPDDALSSGGDESRSPPSPRPRSRRRRLQFSGLAIPEEELENQRPETAPAADQPASLPE